MDRLESIVDWRVRAAHYDKADPGVALDMIAVQLNDPARLFPPAPPIPPERRLVPRHMPNPRAPTFRLSEQQRRWMNAAGIVIEAARAWCLHGEPIAISAQGLASFGGRAALDNDPMVADPDNQAARTAVLAAEQAMLEQQGPEFSDEAGPQQVDDDDELDNGAGIDRVDGRDERVNDQEALEQQQQQPEAMDATGIDRDSGRDVRANDQDAVEQQQPHSKAMATTGIDRDGGRDVRANVQDGARDAQAARPVGSGRFLAGTCLRQSSNILHQARRQQARRTTQTSSAPYLLARAIVMDVVARSVAAAGSPYAFGAAVTEPPAQTVPGNAAARSQALRPSNAREHAPSSSTRWHPP